MNPLQKIPVIALVIVVSLLSLTAQTVVMTDQRSSKRQIESPEPIVVSIDANGRLKLGAKSVTIYRLGRSLNVALDERKPPDRMIYLKAGPGVPFSKVLTLLKLGRMLKQDSFGLILDGEGVEDTTGAVFTKISLEKPTRRDNRKPNPLSLVLTFQTVGEVFLNGTSHTPISLMTRLREIFKARADNGVYVEGTEQVERTVFLVPSTSTTFATILQAARLLKDAGATPIGIAIDRAQPTIIEKFHPNFRN